MDSQQNNQNNTQNNPTPNMNAGNNNTILAVFSYLGPLVIISYLMGKDNAFVKFHAKQGVVLFGIEVIVAVLSGMLYSVFMLLNIINLATLILSIIGIVNAVQGNQKELPVIGSLAKSFNL